MFGKLWDRGMVSLNLAFHKLSKIYKKVQKQMYQTLKGIQESKGGARVYPTVYE